ncbi:hypothetical protein FVE85_2999 [Porphyridium purpureum]|uniref:DUF202 domain-containing protein n=1 Tax=Porphyridium purpureum TaxID=35688 RepID=A0A5J4YU90_PORPP|nr:hypothetical protein FVE85_2999 [Porphyridium purpureum]|eukprot:POR1516..scf227_4
MRPSLFVREVVKNTGSTARDHLANERTFLAWSRTGLSFMAASAGLFSAYSLGGGERTSTSDVDAHALLPRRVREVVPSCLFLAANGVAFLGFATKHYFRVMNELKRGNFVINRTGLGALTAFTSVNTLAAIGMLVSPNRFWIVAKPERNEDASEFG